MSTSPPSTFGAQRRMAISRHSGRAAVAAKLEALGLQSSADLVERIYEQLIRHGEPLCSDNRLRTLAAECYA